MTLEDSVHVFRPRVLQRAEELGNVSAACREAGIPRTLFYRWKKRFTLYGIDGLHPRRAAARPGMSSAGLDQGTQGYRHGVKHLSFR